MEFSSFLYISNLIGVIAFAASGVFKGIKHDNDIFGVTLLAIVTAVGGGITRDIMLNIIPNAIINPSDIYLAIITALVIYLPYLFFKKKIKDLMTKKEFYSKIDKASSQKGRRITVEDFEAKYL